MLFLFVYLVVENFIFIKLIIIYICWGYGICISLGCFFIYVIRYKLFKCFICGNFLGGKWILKEKLVKVKVELVFGVFFKSFVVKRN